MSHAEYLPPQGATRGGVAAILRLEGAVVLALSAACYGAGGGSWLVFAALFLIPDASMLGYLADRRLGAAVYNAGHSYLGPAALWLVGWRMGAPMLSQIALIWSAHIGFDRLMGYGLKYATAFGDTHLGWRGRGARGEAVRA